MPSETESPIRVVIIDDHPMIRDGTAAYLQETDDIEVVGVAADGTSGLDQVRAHNPDVLVLDLRLPDMSGVDVARQLRTELPGLSIVVMTGYDYQAYRRELGRLGISTVLGKTASGSEIASAVRAAAAGEPAAVGEPSATGATDFSEQLTTREYQVLEMMTAGKRNPEIAETLFVSLKTIEFHVSNLLNKLGARSRTDAVLRAQGFGLIAPQMLPPEAWPPPKPRKRRPGAEGEAEGDEDKSGDDADEPAEDSDELESAADDDGQPNTEEPVDPELRATANAGTTNLTAQSGE